MNKTKKVRFNNKKKIFKINKNEKKMKKKIKKKLLKYLFIIKKTIKAEMVC